MTPDNILRFDIDGKAAPQGSVKVGRQGQVYPAARGLRAWRETVATYATVAAHREQFVLQKTDPVRVVMRFTYGRPDSHFRRSKGHRLLRADAPVAKTTTPDLDKLVRAVLDALVIGRVLHDDRQVASLTAEKAWGTGDRVEIMIRPIDWDTTVDYARA